MGEVRLESIARECRVQILRMLAHAGSGHPGGSLSVIDILTTLYFGRLRFDAKRPDWPDRDRVVLSKGHAVPALYAVLAKAGYFPEKQLITLRKLGSPLQGHPDRTALPGIEAATGSLGQGLSISLGMALGLKLAGSRARVYCILGDGEIQEGQVWEAAMSAPKLGQPDHALDNLVVILDYNKIQLDNFVKKVLDLEPVTAKWQSFGWPVVEIDGHDVAQIAKALDQAEATTGVPTFIVAHTVKGKGVSFMENDPEWHGKAPKPAEAIKAIREVLGVAGGRLGGLPEHRLGDARDRGRARRAGEEVMPAKASRAAFGEALLDLGAKDERIVTLDADLSKSTMTVNFAKKYPARAFNLGIAESNMIGVGAGLALTGRIPFACSFACFVVGRFETIRISVAYTNANLKIVGTHSGIAIGEDGYSQMGIEDIACIRALPNIGIVQPADELETKQAIAYAVEHQGPLYLRLTRQNLEPVCPPDYRFQYGRWLVLRKGHDVSLIASGGTVFNCVEAAKRLEADGISAEVINAACIKPLDEELLVQSAGKTGHVVTVEDHAIAGGLGGAVAELLGDVLPTPMKRLGVQGFGESGDAKGLYAKHGLDPAGITASVKKFLHR